MKLSMLCAILFSLSTLFPTQFNPGKHLIGAWKGKAENGKDIVIEFDKEGNYNLIHGGKLLTCGDEDFGQIKYSLEQNKKEASLWVVLYDEVTLEEYSRLLASFSEKKETLTLTLYFGSKAVDEVELVRSELGI